MPNKTIFTLFLSTLTTEEFLFFILKPAPEQLVQYVAFLEANFQKQNQIVLN